MWFFFENLYLLQKLGCIPNGLILPISAVILANKGGYDKVLESFSKPLLHSIQTVAFTRKDFRVNENSLEKYCYIDFTNFVTYLCECLSQCEHQIDDGVNFVKSFDIARSTINDEYDMKFEDIDRLIRSIGSNQGKLSRRLRKKFFSDFSEGMLSDIESIVCEAFNLDLP